MLSYCLLFFPFGRIEPVTTKRFHSEAPFQPNTLSTALCILAGQVYAFGDITYLMVKELDNEIVVSYYVHFQTTIIGKDIKLFIFRAIGYIIPIQVFYKEYFGIK